METLLARPVSLQNISNFHELNPLIFTSRLSLTILDSAQFAQGTEFHSLLLLLNLFFQYTCLNTRMEFPHKFPQNYLIFHRNLRRRTPGWIHFTCGLSGTFLAGSNKIHEELLHFPEYTWVALAGFLIDPCQWSCLAIKRKYISFQISTLIPQVQCRWSTKSQVQGEIFLWPPSSVLDRNGKCLTVAADSLTQWLCESVAVCLLSTAVCVKQTYPVFYTAEIWKENLSSSHQGFMCWIIHELFGGR